MWSVLQLHRFTVRSSRHPTDLGADLVVEAVGIAATRSDALALVGPGGEIAHIGLRSETGEVPLADVVRGRATIRVYAYTREHFATALQLLSENPPPLAWLAEVGFYEGPGWLTALAAGRGPLKAIFTFR